MKPVKKPKCFCGARMIYGQTSVGNELVCTNCGMGFTAYVDFYSMKKMWKAIKKHPLLIHYVLGIHRNARAELLERQRATTDRIVAENEGIPVNLFGNGSANSDE